MTVSNCYIATGNDDWFSDTNTGNQYTTLTIKAAKLNDLFPNVTKEAIGEVTTSIVGTDDISVATVSWNENDYNAPKGVAKSYNLKMFNGVGYTTIQSYTFTSAGTIKTYTLDATQRGWINKTGKTKFLINVDDPGAGSAREFQLDAYETSQATAMRMTITHAPASTPFYQVIITSTN